MKFMFSHTPPVDAAFAFIKHIIFHGNKSELLCNKVHLTWGHWKNFTILNTPRYYM